MYIRFINNVNNLKFLGKVYSIEDMISKLLRSLPRHLWGAKVMAIEEA